LTATAYCPCEICCGKWANGLTYTGAIAGKGCIAIDPKKGPLKLGQEVYIKGYGYGVCNDIGGAIKGWKIDLCFDTHEEALEWGVKLVRVYIIDGGE
jgi:3D (Asp-Asp-Asp) domain-containing protein